MVVHDVLHHVCHQDPKYIRFFRVRVVRFSLCGGLVWKQTAPCPGRDLWSVPEISVINTVLCSKHARFEPALHVSILSEGPNLPEPLNRGGLQDGHRGSRVFLFLGHRSPQ